MNSPPLGSIKNIPVDTLLACGRAVHLPECVVASSISYGLLAIDPALTLIYTVQRIPSGVFDRKYVENYSHHIGYTLYVKSL